MPNEFGYPGLPVLGDGERLRRNAIQREWANPRQIKTERPSMNALYDEEGEADALLAAAKETLAVPPPSSYLDMKRNEHARNDAPAAAAQKRAEFRSGPVGGSIHALTDNPAVTAATVAGSFVPHPLAQGASKALLALQSGAGMLDPETSIPEKAMWAGGAALGLRSPSPAMAGPKRPVPGMHWTARQPAETPYRVAGELPSNISGSADDITNSSASSPSMRALRGNSAPEDDLIDSVDLTDAINAMGGPSGPAPGVARARAAERFGRNYRSESTAELPNVLDESGRMVAPAQAPLDPAYAAHVASSRNKHAPVTVQDQERMRLLVHQLFGENPSPSVSRLTAQEALADDAVIGMTKKGKPIKSADVDDDNVIFGGASAREFGSGPEAGNFVRPKDRTPIGKRPAPPAWRMGREDPIQWNPNSPTKADATQFLSQQLNSIGGLAKADAELWAHSPNEHYRERLVTSFKPHLKNLHTALRAKFGDTVTLHRAEHAADPSTGIRSFSLAKEGAEDFLGQNYRGGASDTLHTVQVPVEDILGIGSAHSGEVLVDSTKHIVKKK